MDIDDPETALSAKLDEAFALLEEKLSKSDANRLRQEVDKIAAFARSAAIEDDVGMIVRTHTAVERELTALLKVGCKEPKVLLPTDDALKFELKVNVAVAFGLVPSRWGPFLRKLGALRNKAAHGKIEAIDMDMVRQFFGTLDSGLRVTVNEAEAAMKKVVMPFDSASLGAKDRFAYGCVIAHMALVAARLVREEAGRGS